ncbi:hypothetical protein LS72_008970 [Helicobacter apodemus]|uniref:Uncharacterized protein n=1 Tax=Helicobacter apodemus TaxID=135569 RepID=A0A4U8UDS3_9HELI|nr:hypothetical protein [Helicobacter apodemus]TLE14217.1 hypothetical protein LS72_008970 [Helicobacter apodemus]
MLNKKPIILSTRLVVWSITLFNFGLVVLGLVCYALYYGIRVKYILFVLPIPIVFSILMLCYIEQSCHRFFVIRIFRMKGKQTLRGLLDTIFLNS